MSDNSENDNVIKRPFFRASCDIQKNRRRTHLRPQTCTTQNYRSSPFEKEPNYVQNLDIDIEHETLRLQHLEDKSKIHKLERELAKAKTSLTYACKEAIEQNASEQKNVLEAEMERIKAEMAEDMIMLNNNNAALVEEMLLLKNQNNHLKATFDQLSQTHLAAQSEIRSQNQELLAVLKDNTDLEDALEEQSNKCSTLQNRLDEGLLGHKKILEENQELKDLCNKQLKQINFQCERIEGLSTLSSDHQLLCEKYKILRKNLDEAKDLLQVTSDNLIVPIQALMSSLQQYQSNYDGLLGMQSTCLSEQTNLKLALANEEHKVKKLTELAENHEMHAQAVELQLAKLEASLASRDAECDQNERLLADSRGTAYKHASLIQRLEDEIEALNNTIKTLNLKLEQRLVENTNLEKDLCLYTDKVSLCEQQQLKLNDAISARDKQLSQQQQELIKLESTVDLEQNKAEDLSSQLDNYKMELAAAIQHESNLKCRLNEKLVEITAANAHIEELQSINRELSSSLQSAERVAAADVGELAEKTRLLQVAKKDLQKSEEKLAHLTAENATLNRELMNANAMILVHKNQILDAGNEISEIRDAQAKLETKNRELLASIESKEKLWGSKSEELILDCNSQVAAIKMLQEQVSGLVAERSVILEKLVAEQKSRRLLTHQIVELKGSIRVFCRIRPLLPEETDTPGFLVESSDEGEMSISIQSAAKSSTNVVTSASRFVYDRIFTSLETNEHVFEEVELLIKCAIDGYNACIFAYGQTGSGKSYTMCSDDGVIARSIAKIFEIIDSSTTAEITVTGEFIEIYNENIYDLTEDKHDGARSKLELRQQNNKTYVLGTKVHNLDSQEALERLLNAAHRRRSTAATMANARSSRSHSVFIIRIRNRNILSGKVTTGILNLVDLAGSERLNESKVEGERLKETQAINKSLAALGNVMQALTTGVSTHIPFRASKLTHLLQDSLSGTSKTLMIVNITSASKSINETLSTLTFADKVSRIKLKK